MACRVRTVPYAAVSIPWHYNNIARLVELCSEQSAWGEALEDAEELTPFAISARYPGENESVSEAEARRTVDIAARVQQVVWQALNEDGVSL